MIDFEMFIVKEMGLSKDEVLPLYEIYLNEMDDMIIALDSASKSSDYDTFKRTLHNIKGISANLRLEDMTAVVSDMYSKLKSDEQIDLYASLETIKKLLEQVRKEINTYFNRSF